MRWRVPVGSGANVDETVYVGTASGSVASYAVPADHEWAGPSTQAVSRRSVEQVVRVPRTDYLALVSDGCVMLWDEKSKPVRLPPTKTAKAVAVGTWTESAARSRRRPRASRAVGLRGMDEIAEEMQSPGGVVHVSMLAVACRRHLVVYRWVDGVFWDQKELGLPHAPLTLAVLPGQGVFVGCAVDDYVRVQVPSVHASTAASLPQRSAETGATALVVGDWTDDSEWPVYAVTIPPSLAPAPEPARGWGLMTRRPPPLLLALDTHVLVGLEQCGVLVDGMGRARRTPQLPWDAPPRAIVDAAPYLVLVPSSGTHLAIHMRNTLRLVQTVPLDGGSEARMLAASGAAVYAALGGRAALSLLALRSRPWAAQLEDLERAGEYDEALTLLDMLDAKQLPDVASRRARMQGLVGVQRFEQGEYDAAMDLFIEVDMNPAKVLALYPPEIAGALARGSGAWRALFGAQQSVGKSDERETPRAALDALARFLTDRRRVVRPLVAHLSSASSQEPRAAEALLALPISHTALETLDEEQLMLVAQLVDTALFKTFLHTKPALVGPLCRVDNWCEVRQVERLLKAHGMSQELVALYRAKSMHREALGLLHEQAQDAHGEEKVRPTIEYLQALGSDDVDLVLEYAHWVLAADPVRGMEIFTDACRLPRLRVVEDLEAFNPALCITYLNYLLSKDEGEPMLHTKLALLYLQQCQGKEGDAYHALLDHLHTSTQYDARALLPALPPAPAFAAAHAEVLGRLGRHDEALRLYVVHLEDLAAAERYCVDANAPGIWLLLLRLALEHSEDRRAALGLLARHAAAMPVDDALALLPKSCTVRDVQEYLCKALRAQASERSTLQVVQHVAERRADDVGDALRGRQQRHVLVAESRTCAQCQRRLGNAVLAVMPGSGKTLHYYCAHEGHRLR